MLFYLFIGQLVYSVHGKGADSGSFEQSTTARNIQCQEISTHIIQPTDACYISEENTSS